MAASSQTKTSICFDCEKALGGCSWAEHFIVPDGAKSEELYDSKKPSKHIGTYIYECPLFEQTPPRRSTGILSEEDNERFLAERAMQRARRRVGRPVNP